MNWIKKIFGKIDKEDLTKSLEKIYSDLKNKNPNKDEHWLLANTWWARYGDWEASKQKGPKLTRYIAYTTAFSFSLLDFPQSIRGFALYLVYKELEKKEAEDGAEEFNQIMESITKIEKSGKLIDKYKQKNPFTYNEILQENDKSIYGLLGFLETTEHLEKNN